MKKFKIIFILLICFIFVGCSFPTNDQKKIYSDEKLMVTEGDSYNSKKISINENTIYLESFTGSYTMWEKEVEDNTNFIMNFKCNEKKGKYKIILIKDNEIYKSIINNKENVDKEIEYNLDPGKYRIKIIGLFTTLDMKYEIKDK